MSTTYTCPAAEAAKKIRADIKTALADGSLTLPDGAKVSVTKASASMMIEVRIRIKGLPDSWAWAPVPDAPGRYQRTADSAELAAKLREIAARHWDWNNHTRFLDVGLATATGTSGL